MRGMALGQRGDRSWAGWVEGEVGRCGGKERKRVGPGVREWAEAGLRARDGLLGHGALLEFRWV